MENLIVSFDIVLPLFLLMAVGYAAKRLGFLDEKSTRTMNNLVFRIFLPVMLFRNISTSTLDGGISPGIFVYVTVTVCLQFLLLFLLIPKIEKDRTKIGVLIQGIGRSNYAYFGIPLVNAMLPNSDMTIASLLVAITIPLFNTFSVVALEMYRGGKTDCKKICIGIAKNPLIDASLIGVVVLLFGWTLPSPLAKTADNLGKISTPLALFLLGASFDFKKLGANARQLAYSVPARLVISPILFLIPAVALGFRGVELACVLVTFASPTAVSSFPMAQQMGGDGDLAGQQVVLTSVFSAVSVFFLIFLLKQFGLA